MEEKVPGDAKAAFSAQTRVNEHKTLENALNVLKRLKRGRNVPFCDLKVRKCDVLKLCRKSD